MPDNQADIKIGVQYDGDAAKEALLDLERLPPAAVELGGDINATAIAAKRLEDALVRANISMREHLSTLDPTAAGYAKAAAQAQSYIARQTALANKVDILREGLVKQTEALDPLIERFNAGAISEETFLEGCDNISQGVIKTQRSLEMLEAQMRALSSNQQALKTPEVKPVSPVAMHSWTAFMGNLKKGFASGTLSCKQFLSAAGGLLRIAAWGAVAKVGLDGVANAGSKIRESMGLAEKQSISFGNFFKGVLVMASEGVGMLLSGMTKLFGGTDGWFAKITKKVHKIIGNISEAGAAQDEQNQKLREEADIREQILQKQHEQYQEARKSLQDAATEGFSHSLEQAIAAAKETAEAQKQIAQQDYEAAQRTLQEKQQAIELQTQAAQQEIELARARGKIDEETAKLRLAAVQEEHDKRMAGLQEEASTLRVALADDMAEAGRQLREALDNVMDADELQKFAPVLEVKLPDEKRLKEIEMKLLNPNSKLTEAARQALQQEQQQIREEARNIARLLVSIDSSLSLTGPEAVEMARSMQEAAAAAAREQVAATQAADDLADDAAAARQIATIDEQKAEALKKSAGVTREIARQESRRKAQAEAVTAALKNIEASYKTSTSYAELDSRTEEQKIIADRQMLAAKQRKLEALAATPDMDAKTQQQVNEALAQTRQQLAAYKATLQAGSQRAKETLNEWQPLGLKATSASLQGNLKRLDKHYGDLAKKAEQAARNGDAKALERAREQMAKVAWQYERLSGYTGQMASKHQELLAALQKVDPNGLTAAQEQENKVARALGMEAPNAEKRASASKASADASQKAAKAHEKEAAAAEAAADAAQKNAAAQQQTNTQDPNQQTGQDPNANAAQLSSLQATCNQLAASLQQAQQGLAQINTSLQQTNTQQTQLNAAITQLAATAAALAATATAGFAAAQKLNEQLRQSLRNLERTVEKLSRP